MTESGFKKIIAELRKSIYLGNVTEGVAKIMEMLLMPLDDDEKIELLLELVLLSLACNDYEEAIEKWTEACDCRHDMQNLRMRGYKAFFELIDGRKKHGFAELAKVIEEDPNSFEFHLLRGIAYIQLNQYEHAQADLVRASSLFPENVLVMSILADVSVELNDIPKAMMLHEQVLTVSPDYRRSLMSLGVLYIEQERMEDAFRLFQCLVAYDPINWFAWSCLGDIRVTEKGKTFQALPYYAAAVVAGTEVANVYLNLARGLMALGKFEQARNVLELYPKNTGNKWRGEELMAARYLTLVCDVIKTPGILQTPEFLTRLKTLKPCHDEASKILFHLLATLASISYQEDINLIYAKHIKCFVLTAQYLTVCCNRVIYPEETVMYCVIARLMAWHGMFFEIHAFLRLFEQAEDPRVQDMANIIVNEMHKFAEISDKAYINLENFHQKIIQIKGHDEISVIDKIMSGEIITPPNKEEWIDDLQTALLNLQNSDIRRTFVQPPVLEPIQLFETCLNIQVPKEQQEDFICELWADYDVWLTWYQMQKSTNSFEELWETGSQQFRSNFTTWPYLKKIVELHHIQPETENIPHQPADQFALLLKSLFENNKQQINTPEILAANSDIAQVCAATPDEALGGFAPLPFAIDGTAFRRFMSPAKQPAERLNTANYGKYLKAWMLSCQNIHPQNTGIQSAPPKTQQKAFQQFEKFLQALHGEKRLRENLILSITPNAEHMIQLALPQTEFWDHLKILGESGVLGLDGLQFPKAPLFASSILIGTQKFPAFLRDAEALERPISCNLISCHNLAEFFYNHAINLIETWKETKDNTLLTPLVSHPYRKFAKFKALAELQPNAAKKQNNCKNEENQKHKEISKPLLDFYENPEAAIETVDDLAESLEQYTAWYQNISTSIVDINFHLNAKHHLFTQQFKIWARQHAENLYPEISRAEAEVRSVTPATLYLVTWRIRELIRRFPWMSRLYVLLASAYARVEQYEEALKAIESGLEHEHKLYKNTGWHAVASQTAETEQKLEAVETLTEFEDSQMLLWPERYVFQPKDEAMYHYAAFQSGYPLRRRRKPSPSCHMQRTSRQDKAGAFECYQLFKRFIPRISNLRDAYFSALAQDNIYTLRDFMVHIISQMVAPETFPLRRQIAELLFALYPDENTGALGKFYCDNMQPANALPMAAYAYFAESTEEEDDETESSVTIGCLLYDMGYMEQAMQYLDRAINVKNPSPMAFLTRGCALIEMRALDKAVECLKAGLVIDPSSDRFHYNLALAYIEQGKIDEAEQSIKTGIQLAKYPVDLNLQLMRIYVRKQKFIEALPLAKYVASEDPDMFLAAMRFDEFAEFRELKPVKDLIAEYHYDPNDF